MKFHTTVALSVAALIGVPPSSAWGKNLRVRPLVKDTLDLSESIGGVDLGPLPRLPKDPPGFKDTSETNSPSSAKKKDAPAGVVESESIAEGGDSDPSTKDPPKGGDTENNDHHGLLWMSNLKASLTTKALEAESVYEESTAVTNGHRRLGSSSDSSSDDSDSDDSEDAKTEKLSKRRTKEAKLDNEKKAKRKARKKRKKAKKEREELEALKKRGVSSERAKRLRKVEKLNKKLQKARGKQEKLRQELKMSKRNAKDVLKEMQKLEKKRAKLEKKRAEAERLAADGGRRGRGLGSSDDRKNDKKKNRSSRENQGPKQNEGSRKSQGSRKNNFSPRRKSTNSNESILSAFFRKSTTSNVSNNKETRSQRLKRQRLKRQNADLEEHFRTDQDELDRTKKNKAMKEGEFEKSRKDVDRIRDEIERRTKPKSVVFSRNAKDRLDIQEEAQLKTDLRKEEANAASLKKIEELNMKKEKLENKLEKAKAEAKAQLDDDLRKVKDKLRKNKCRTRRLSGVRQVPEDSVCDVLEEGKNDLEMEKDLEELKKELEETEKKREEAERKAIKLLDDWKAMKKAAAPRSWVDWSGKERGNRERHLPSKRNSDSS